MKKCLFCWRNLLDHTMLHEAFSLLQHRSFCASCAGQLELIGYKQTHCLRCQKKMSQQTICDDCLYWERAQQIKIDQQSIFYYNDFIVDVLWQIKHNRDIHLIRGFYAQIIRKIRRTYDLAHAVFVPIPTDVVSLKERRFHLISLVLRELPLRLQIHDVFQCIAQKRTKQHVLAKEQRLQLADTSYGLNEDELAALQTERCRHIVIVDDVYTTGATMVKAIKSLRFAQQKKIGTFTLFR